MDYLVWWAWVYSISDKLYSVMGDIVFVFTITLLTVLFFCALHYITNLEHECDKKEFANWFKSVSKPVFIIYALTICVWFITPNPVHIAEAVAVKYGVELPKIETLQIKQ